MNNVLHYKAIYTPIMKNALHYLAITTPINAIHEQLTKGEIAMTTQRYFYPDRTPRSAHRRYEHNVEITKNC